MNEKINSYISRQKSPQKEIFTKLRLFLLKLLPTAEEYIGYGVPAFKLKGESIYYAVFKTHIGIYPGAEIIEIFKEKLKGYKTSKGTIQFDINKPIPYQLIHEILRYKYKI